MIAFLFFASQDPAAWAHVTARPNLAQLVAKHGLGPVPTRRTDPSPPPEAKPAIPVSMAVRPRRVAVQGWSWFPWVAKVKAKLKLIHIYRVSTPLLLPHAPSFFSVHVFFLFVPFAFCLEYRSKRLHFSLTHHCRSQYSSTSHQQGDQSLLESHTHEC